MEQPSVDIIIRFKNEEFWLRKLKKRFDTINCTNIHLYGVDNNSTDESKSVFEQFENKGIKSINYQNIDFYTPGSSLNLGIEKGNSDFILFLSAHCIPKNDNYILQLYEELIKEDKNCAGVYGRQLPLPCSGAQNTVDLALTYPNEDRILRRTPLFNNANSMIKRKIYTQFPFDQNVTNLEDLIWAKNLQNKGFYFKYTNKAEVYHFHGIHQHKLTNSSHRISSSLTVLLNSGWLSIDSPDFCDYRELVCLFKNTLSKKNYLGQKSDTGEFKFIELYGAVDINIKKSVDYFLFSSTEFSEKLFTDAFREVSEQTSQVSRISKKKYEHNLQEVLTLDEINNIVNEDSKDLLFVSNTVFNQLITYHA